jgi:DNA-binding MarR family transcriptional regulator
MTTPTIIDPKLAAALADTLSRADGYRLSMPTLRILLEIHAAGADCLTMTSVARRLKTESANVTGLADRLESLGLIAREPSPADRRVIWLRITPRGLDCLTDILTPA